MSLYGLPINGQESSDCSVDADSRLAFKFAFVVQSSNSFGS